MKTQRYVVATASAKMPTNCWGRYIRVAVVETTDGETPSMISERAKNVVRVLRVWERCNVGRTSRCASARALAAAQQLADKFNAAL